MGLFEDYVHMASSNSSMGVPGHVVSQGPVCVCIGFHKSPPSQQKVYMKTPSGVNANSLVWLVKSRFYSTGFRVKYYRGRILPMTLNYLFLLKCISLLMYGLTASCNSFQLSQFQDRKKKTLCAF